jgi:hypothetical protein
MSQTFRIGQSTSRIRCRLDSGTHKDRCCNLERVTLSMAWACIACRFFIEYQDSRVALCCTNRFLVHLSDLKRDTVGRRKDRSVEELRLLPADLTDIDHGSFDRSRGLLDEASQVLRLTEVTNLLTDLRLCSVMGLVDEDEASSTTLVWTSSSSSLSLSTSDSL